MRPLRKTMLLATLAIAALAFAAPAASGQTLEIYDEASDEPCGDVTITVHHVEGDCGTHVVSTDDTVLRQHIFGVESTVGTCSMEFIWYVDGDGEGYFAVPQFGPPVGGGTCTRQACEEEEGVGGIKPWHAYAKEETVVFGNHFMAEHALVQMCFETEGTSHQTIVNCEMPFPLEAYGENHEYELGLPPTEEMFGSGNPGFRCEMRGHWVTEGAESGMSSGLEIEHVEP